MMNSGCVLRGSRCGSPCSGANASTGSFRRAGRSPPVIGRTQHLQDAEIGRRRDDADNRARPIVQAHAFPDDIRIALKLPLPQRFADEHDVAAAGLVLVGGEHPAHGRVDAEHRQEPLGDVQGCHARRIAVVEVQVGFAGNERGEIGQAPAALFEVQIIRQRCRFVSGAARAIRLPDHHQPLHVVKRHRPQQTASTTLKIAVVMPIPSASVSRATMANPGFARRDRNPS